MSEERLERLEKIVESNAKSIEALSNAVAQDREAQKKEREERESLSTQLYQYLGRIAAAQSSFYEVQADYYHQLAALAERQTKIEEKQSQMREEILAILNRL